MNEFLPVIEVGERSPERSSASDRACETAVALSALGSAVGVMTPPDDRIRGSCEAAGVPWHRLPLRNPVDLASMRRLARFTKRFKGTIVHAHGPVAHAVALGAHAMGGNFSLVVTRSRTFPVRAWARMAFRTRRVARVVATCGAVRDVVVTTAGLPPKKVDVAYPGVDVERFDPRRTRPGPVRQELGIPPHAHLVVHVGMRDWRGWREVLAAFPHIRASCPEAHLLLVGCRRQDQREWIRALARELRLPEAVTVTKFREDIADVLACGDLFVDASWAGNGINRSLCEAMALGKPVIATSCGGSPEAVLDGQTGILVPTRDTATLVAAVVRLLKDVELAHSLAAAGQQWVVSHFTAERRALRLATIYDAVRREAP